MFCQVSADTVLSSQDTIERSSFTEIFGGPQNTLHKDSILGLDAIDELVGTWRMTSFQTGRVHLNANHPAPDFSITFQEDRIAYWHHNDTDMAIWATKPVDSGHYVLSFYSELTENELQRADIDMVITDLTADNLTIRNTSQEQYPSRYIDPVTMEAIRYMRYETIESTITFTRVK